MFCPQNLGSALANDDAGRHSVAVVTRGMIDPSAMRRLSTPYTLG
jgi:hypothetical protein